MIQNLSKWYGQHLGLAKVNLKFQEGVYGLLGPNGSGKTTLLKILCRELYPSEGEILVNTIPLNQYPHLEREFTYLPDTEGIYSSLTGREFLSIFGQLRGIPKNQIQDKVEKTLDLMKLREVADRKTGTYSRGMKQRLKFGLALMIDYQVYLLDEPLQGTDPLGRALLLDWIKKLSQEKGKIIILSSHILHEIEMVADYVVTMMEGKVVAQGKIEELRSLLSSIPRKLRIQIDKPKVLASLLISQFHIRKLSLKGEFLEIETFHLEPLLEALPSLILDHSLQLFSWECADEKLEEVFSMLTQKRRFQKGA